MAPISGFPFVSSTFSRVTGALSRSVIQRNLERSHAAILLAQEQLSSGKRLVYPSLDPIGTGQALDLKQRIDQTEDFEENVRHGVDRLNLSDFTMDRVRHLILRAHELMLEQLNDAGADAQTRRLVATEVDQLLREAVTLANTVFEGRAVFAGSATVADAFSFVDGGVVYNGNQDDVLLPIAQGLQAPCNIPGTDAFNAFSSEIRGTVDLDPGVTAATKVSALNGGRGVRLGSLTVWDGFAPGGPVTVDLSIAEEVGDVVDLINDVTATSGVTALVPSATGDGLRLNTGTGVVMVQEVSGGDTAADLGLLTPPAGLPTPFDGTDIDPVLSLTTPLADLFDGTGAFDPTGFTITNTTSSTTYTATISLAGMTTMEDLLTAINQSGTQVFARINDNGDGLDVVSRLSGARLTITEAGGTTAADFGLLLTLDRQLLADLNNGYGVDQAGGGNDLRITRADGVTIDVDIANARTLGDVISLVNNDSENTGGLLVVDVDPATLDRLRFTDNSVGVTPFNIIYLNESQVTTSLGMDNLTPAGPSVYIGTALNPAGVQAENIFTALIRLREALLADNREGIRAQGRLLQLAEETTLAARGELGGLATRLNFTHERHEDAKVVLQGLLSETEDVDMAEVATRFQLQQVILQAGLSAAARILNTTLFNYL